jgi:hypothetical protein
MKHIKCKEAEYLINYWDLRKYDFTAVVNIPIFFVSAVGLAMQ